MIIRKPNKKFKDTRIYSSDGCLVFVYEGRKLIRLSDQVEIKSFEEIKADMFVFSNDARFMLAKSCRGKLVFIDTSKGKILKKLTFQNLGNEQWDSAIISPDNKHILNIVLKKNSWQSYLSVWDTEIWKETRYFEDEEWSLTNIEYICSKEKYLISGNKMTNRDEPMVRACFCLWFDPKLSSFELIYQLSEVHRSEIQRGDQVYINIFTPPTNFIYSESLNDLVCYYERVEGFKQLRFLFANKSVNLDEGQGAIRSVELSPDEKILGVVFSRNAILYSFPDLKPLDELSDSSNAKFQFLPLTSYFYTSSHYAYTYFYKKNKEGHYGK